MSTKLGKVGGVDGVEAFSYFSGERGPCVQLNTNVDGYADLDRDEVGQLIMLLIKWRNATAEKEPGEC